MEKGGHTMMIKEIIGKILAGERDGTTLWKIAINEIDYPPITDPAEGVSVALLAENILNCGQLQPILLYRPRKATVDQPYSLISGRRRLEAMRMLGHTYVNAIVVRCDEVQAHLFALSENFLHREANVWEVATHVKALIDAGVSIHRISALLAISIDRLEEVLALLDLPDEEARLMKIARVTWEDVHRLMNLSSYVRREILETVCGSSDEDLTKLLDDWSREPEPSTLQPYKICVGDVRLFLNTIDRGAQRMRSAGYDINLQQSEADDGYDVTIRIAKRAGVLLKPKDAADVSRETSEDVPVRSRFSSALSIFEAIAEDECAFCGDVSRETL
jgi:ParB family chromosome partitioning protein